MFAPEPVSHGMFGLTPYAPRSIPRAPLEKMALPRIALLVLPARMRTPALMGTAKAIRLPATPFPPIMLLHAPASHSTPCILLPSSVSPSLLVPIKLPWMTFQEALVSQIPRVWLAEIRLPAPVTIPPIVLDGARSA